MDDTAQKQQSIPLQQTSQDAPQDSNVDQQPSQDTVGMAPMQEQQEASVSMTGFSKEAGPVVSMSGLEAAPMDEAPIQQSEQAPELPKEVQEAGVEVSPNAEVPNLTIQDQNAGLTHAPVIAPVPTQPTDTVILPMTEHQAMMTLKTNKKPTNSIAWLATAVLRQLKIIKEKGDTHA